ncbi:MAG: hypothetical protein PSN46_05405 [Gammaproteobacteria bacterium]|nr:hypothetical protein [Gammaproteobacteria bacterium]
MNQTYFCPLDDTGCLSLTGQDAQMFLQGQVTCDVSQVSDTQGQPGAYCTPKGNVIANFDLVSHQHTFLLHMPLNMIASVQMAMAKYIVFSKAEVKDSSDHWCRFALWGEAAAVFVAQLTGLEPQGRLSIGQFDEGFVWANNSAGNEYVIYCQPKSKAALIQKFEEQAIVSNLQTWEALQINQGRVYVTPEISDSYVPQMLNLQATGAINFKKGCYTGQEIVARMQYLGKLKRHLFIGQVNTAHGLAVGQQIDASKRKNVGRVTSAASTGDNTYTFTAVINRTEAEEDQLHLHEQEGATVRLLPLPYEIDPQVFERMKL